MESRKRCASALRANCRVFCGPPGYSRQRVRYLPSGRLSMLAIPFPFSRPGRVSPQKVLSSPQKVLSIEDYSGQPRSTSDRQKSCSEALYRLNGRVVTVSRPVGGVLSIPCGTGWPSICAAHLGTSTGPVVPRLALLRVGFAEPSGSPRALVHSYR